MIRGRRKALFIGCNYTGQANELKGCINDCHNMAAFIMSKYGFQDDNILMLTDDQDDPDYLPTAEHIVSGMHWLVYDAMPGDSLFFHFSGHGMSHCALDGDEADGFDEAICPMDYKESGVIVDDMLHEILVRPLQPGVRLTAVFDCCHSGTALDLPYVYQCDGEIQVCTESYRGAAAKAFVEMARNAVYAAGQLMEGIKLLRKKGDNKDAQRKTEQMKTSMADVIMFSGCRDDQTAADLYAMEQATGALSTALIATLSEDGEQTYTELLRNLRRKMKGQFTQVPQLSTGHPMDMNIRFMM
ncbi:peptidase C14 [Syncephalis pseudoplumigaleata]|uniref:Peptidase C14 n=1 Tax=Syncephalis pseudoplumigaleata TaxID=1712513 RepID=A0A4P9YX13_9FUNG|nr:peptidase C14 [Syncephalis pseudoplumigaleata]|eukprot:RKP23500.1 peptidase C14 [Syncephalis pseudoplumigaleata]